jgi:hypothetical protein
VRLVFVDESGYATNWMTQHDVQPYFALAAVCLPVESYRDCCGLIRDVIASLRIPGQEAPLGLGYEIKARDIARGTGWWQDHELERNTVRETMLLAPLKFEGVAIVVLIDKAAHLRQYAYPDNPYQLARRFLLERVQGYLLDVDDHGLWVWDQSKAQEDEHRDHTIKLMREGSGIRYWSQFFGQEMVRLWKIDRVVEVMTGRSEDSVGLQIADFFASMTNFYHRDGKPSGCGWWETLAGSLRRKNGLVAGWGLKAFP